MVPDEADLEIRRVWHMVGARARAFAAPWQPVIQVRNWGHPVGTVGMQASRFESMLRMVESGKLAPGKLVHRTIPLEEAGAVVASMDNFATLGVTVIDRY